MQQSARLIIFANAFEFMTAYRQNIKNKGVFFIPYVASGVVWTYALRGVWLNRVPIWRILKCAVLEYNWIKNSNIFSCPDLRHCSNGFDHAS